MIERLRPWKAGENRGGRDVLPTDAVSSAFLIAFRAISPLARYTEFRWPVVILESGGCCIFT